MNTFNTEQPMANFSKQQKQEAEQLFERALQCNKNNDFIEAAEYYQKAVAYRHPGAQNNLGNMYKTGHGVNRDLQKAFELFLDAATHGNIVAMRNLAICYQVGSGTDADFSAAVSWFMTAAEQRDNCACAMLAKAYDGLQYKDEEKKIYWHKKAAEYGNTDSMFFLGNYYGMQGNNQAYDQAINYYESAAKVGNPKMKLKVAEALDMSYEEKVVNLERAKYWYTEAINCDDDSIKLEAAKGLDVLYSYDGELTRPALDSVKAFMTYRALMNRNKEACALAAYCSEIGKGTNQCIDIAIMLYEKSGDKDRAEWCKKKKSEDLSDHDYEQHIKYSMPSVVKNLHSHGKELYYSKMDSKTCQYDGRIYYTICSYFPELSVYVCSSDFSGNDIEILTEVSEEFKDANIHVNITGAYLYNLGYEDRLLVQHISFEGKNIGECRDEYDDGYESDHDVSLVYFYDNKAYYVYQMRGSKSQIKCMYVDEGRTDVIYAKANTIEQLFATEEKLFFLAQYENDDCEWFGASGWMMLDILSGTIECLSNPYCSPENVVNDPDIYNEDNPRYNNKYYYNRNIISFDFDRGIFWTERTSMEGEDSAHLKPIKYWEPKSLWGDRDTVISDLPIWKIAEDPGRSRRYFDGTYLFHSCCYHVFKSCDVYGNTYVWSRENGVHGVCDEFRVMGDYLFLNVEADCEEQYELSISEVNPIRKSWFLDDLPVDVIVTYQNRLKNKSDSSIKKSVEKSDDFSFGFKSQVSQVIEEQEVSLIEPDELPKEVEDEEPNRDCNCCENKTEVSDVRNPFKLCDLRANVDKFVGAKESLVNFRKSLPEKWDYNAFVGILMSVKGPKYADIACMNMAIGQGDNFKSTETRLEAMGLIDLFNKYKGTKYDQNVTVKEVEDEIITIAPEYKTIRDFFDKVVVTQMSNGNYEVLSNIVKPFKNENTTIRSEGTNQDLYVEKKIGDTDVKYSICTFGSKFNIGFGVPITIQINGNTYECKTHNSAKGRIGGMKKLYTENNIGLGDVLKATYAAADKTIKIEKI